MRQEIAVNLKHHSGIDKASRDGEIRNYQIPYHCVYIKFVLSILNDRIGFTKMGFGEILVTERGCKDQAFQMQWESQEINGEW